MIQTIGRAARNKDARVIMYADTVTGSMKEALAETDRRRNKQIAYNTEHGITPRTIVKPIVNTLQISKKATKKSDEKMTKREINAEIEQLTGLMTAAAASYDFEGAIKLRDRIAELKKLRGEKK